MQLRQTRPVTIFRLDRGTALMAAGILVLIAAPAAALAFWWSSWLMAGCAAILMIVAAINAFRPAVLLRLDAEGYRSRLRFSSGRFAGSWTDVENVEVADGLLILTTADGTQVFPLRLVGRQRVQVLTAFSERLDGANGYQRWLQ
jgi:hypothetical protein